MSLRTLKFGDRTISYETGLDLVHKTREGANKDRRSFDVNIVNDVNGFSTAPIYHQHQHLLPDDGIGTSDDETGSSSSCGGSVKASSCTSDGATSFKSSSSTNNGTDHIPAECFDDDVIAGDEASEEHCRQSRKIVRLDISSLSKLLAFDEEEEDEEEIEDAGNSSNNSKSEGCEDSEAEDKNITKVSNGRCLSSNGGSRDIQPEAGSKVTEGSGSSALVRRHSINLCQSRFRKTSASSSVLPRSAEEVATEASGPKSMMVVGAAGNSSTSVQPRGQQFSASSATSSIAKEPPRISTCQHLEQLQVRVPRKISSSSSNKNSFEISPSYLDQNCANNNALKTLDLRLEEVAHIRSVLTKAQLESLAIDQAVKDDLEKGKICFICMNTRFGLFTRGQKCEMCKQMVCIKCHSKMRIPIEHFTTTPVFALSPSSLFSHQPIRLENNPRHSSSVFVSGSHSLGVQNGGPQFSSLTGIGKSSSDNTAQIPRNFREKKMALPQGLGLCNLQSVGSAPSSPVSSRASSPCPVYIKNDSPSLTLAEGEGVPGFHRNRGAASSQKYATLPRKPRRMSLLSQQRNEEREKLEGSLLTVCTDCKDMVVQVIRVSRTTKRSHHLSGRATIFSLTPDDYVDFKAI